MKKEQKVKIYYKKAVQEIPSLFENVVDIIKEKDYITLKINKSIIIARSAIEKIEVI